MSLAEEQADQADEVEEAEDDGVGQFQDPMLDITSDLGLGLRVGVVGMALVVTTLALEISDCFASAILDNDQATHLMENGPGRITNLRLVFHAIFSTTAFVNTSH